MNLTDIQKVGTNERYRPLRLSIAVIVVLPYGRRICSEGIIGTISGVRTSIFSVLIINTVRRILAAIFSIRVAG